ncbi:Eukaryotic elongation factor 2 kinase [Tetrabaena socialis]|uniref:Eukaryotic elongation factor 2 kinase n=1 Tax=Tetrabaena socialis TaxID=47790 RepID=A0A2J8AID6_9CHLO|nr:Eukaryotic elongation factor 2 kinase [Tetrabaena socialis]|eukprot:PNH12275.1 Eukaryotic elongation factor 2 kinase [Tetrabaena socialis]
MDDFISHFDGLRMDGRSDLPTSSITLISHTHGRERREERGIDRRELQEAVKYGRRERANPGRDGKPRWRFTHKGVVYITDETMRHEITSWRRQDALDEPPPLPAGGAGGGTSHVVVVVDCSGSMRKDDVPGYPTRTAAVYDCLARDLVEPQLRVSLIEMSDGATVLLERSPVDQQLMDYLKRRANSRARYHGNYLPALDAALGLLAGDAARQTQLFLVFLSDGAPSDHTEMVCWHGYTVWQPCESGHLNAKGRPKLQTCPDAKGCRYAIRQQVQELCVQRVKTLGDLLGRDRVYIGTVAFGPPSEEYTVLAAMAAALPRNSFQKLGLSAACLRTAFTSLTSSLTTMRTDAGGGRPGLTLRTDIGKKGQRQAYEESHVITDGMGWDVYCGLLCQKKQRYDLGTGKMVAEPFADSRLADSWRRAFPDKVQRGMAHAQLKFGEGAERVVYQCSEVVSVDDGLTAYCIGPRLVAKSTRFSQCLDDADFHRVFCRTQGEAEELAQLFNRRLQLGAEWQVHFLSCCVYTIKVGGGARQMGGAGARDAPGRRQGGRWGRARKACLACSVYTIKDYRYSVRGLTDLLVEQELEGKFTKWNNNAGGVTRMAGGGKEALLGGMGAIAEEDEEDEDEVDSSARVGIVEHVPQCFSHFTYSVTEGKKLVCDLQGASSASSVNRPRQPIAKLMQLLKRSGAITRSLRGFPSLRRFSVPSQNDARATVVGLLVLVAPGMVADDSAHEDAPSYRSSDHARGCEAAAPGATWEGDIWNQSNCCNRSSCPAALKVNHCYFPRLAELHCPHSRSYSIQMATAAMPFNACWKTVVYSYVARGLLCGDDAEVLTFFMNKRGQLKEAWVNYVALQRIDYTNAFKCKCTSDQCMYVIADGIMLGLKKEKVSLIEMSDGATVLLERSPVDQQLMDFLKRRAKSNARYHGNYLPALDAALGLLAGDATRQTQLFLVFLSDGAPSDHNKMACRHGCVVWQPCEGGGMAANGRPKLQTCPAAKRCRYAVRQQVQEQCVQRIKKLGDLLGRDRVYIGTVAFGPPSEKYTVLAAMAAALPRNSFQKLGLSAGCLRTAFTSLTSSLTTMRTDAGGSRPGLTLRTDIGKKGQRQKKQRYDLGLGEMVAEPFTNSPLVENWQRAYPDKMQRGVAHAKLKFGEGEAEELAQLFNRRLQLGPEWQVHFLSCCVYTIKVHKYDRGMTDLLVEQELEGKFTKWNNNAGGVTKAASGGKEALRRGMGAIAEEDEEEDEAEVESSARMRVVEHVPQCFSHFTYNVTAGKKLVCGLQGVWNAVDGFTMTDPVIHHGSGTKRNGATDKGPTGMAAFFSTHVCNALCRHVKLSLRRAAVDRLNDHDYGTRLPLVAAIPMPRVMPGAVFIVCRSDFHCAATSPPLAYSLGAASHSSTSPPSDSASRGLQLQHHTMPAMRRQAQGYPAPSPEGADLASADQALPRYATCPALGPNPAVSSPPRSPYTSAPRARSPRKRMPSRGADGARHVYSERSLPTSADGGAPAGASPARALAGPTPAACAASASPSSASGAPAPSTSGTDSTPPPPPAASQPPAAAPPGVLRTGPCWVRTSSRLCRRCSTMSALLCRDPTTTAPSKATSSHSGCCSSSDGLHGLSDGLSDGATVLLERSPVDQQLMDFLKRRAKSNARYHGNYLPALDAALDLLAGDATRQTQLFLVFLSDGAPSDHNKMACRHGCVVWQPCEGGGMAANGRPKLQTCPAAKRCRYAVRQQVQEQCVQRIKKLGDLLGRDRVYIGTVAFGPPSEEYTVLAAMAAALPRNSFSSLTTMRTDAGGSRPGLMLRTDIGKKGQRQKKQRYDLGLGEMVAEPFTNSPLVENWQRAYPDKMQRGVAHAKLKFGEGAERVVYQCCEVVSVDGGLTAHCIRPRLVAKSTRFSQHLDDADFHRVFCRTQGEAEELAQLFNRRLQLGPEWQVHFLSCCVYTIKVHKYDRGMTDLLVEQELEGKFTKWNNNAGGVTKAASGGKEALRRGMGAIAEEDEEEDGAEVESCACVGVVEHVPQCFSHFTYNVAQGKKLVCDLQGVWNAVDGFMMTDPVIHHGSGTKRNGATDKGPAGMAAFFSTHVCNALCRRLGLPPGPQR